MSAPPPLPDLQAHWRAFAQASTQQSYCQAWLDLQCARLPAVQWGVLLLRPQLDANEFVTSAGWPTRDAAVPSALLTLADDAATEACGLVTAIDSDGAATGVAYPLNIDGQVAGVVAVAVADAGVGVLTGAMEQLQWGLAWIELLVRRQQRGSLDAELPRLRSAVEIVTAVLAATDYPGACTALVTELASAFACERVSLGEWRHQRVRLCQVSHAAEFGKSMNLVRLLEAAMEEALFQGTELGHPPAPDTPWVTRDHTALAGAHGNGIATYTVPLRRASDIYGALTLERTGTHPFSDDELARIRAIAALSVEALAVRQRAERALGWRLLDAAREQLVRLLGHGYPGRKLAALTAVALLAALVFVEADYRVSANSVLEGGQRQLVVAPFDGYLASAAVRAGDVIAADAELSRLDDRELRLERVNRVSERAMLERRYEEALAGHERGQASVLNAQIAQAQAELDLVESHLTRATLRAPFAGLVISGDLSQRLGGTVEQGEVLFELAPLDDYRLILWIDEHVVSDVHETQSGHVVLNALPGLELAVTVTRVTPVTIARDGGNFFRVEAALTTPSTRLRPGMEGLAKLDVGRRSLCFILTRPLTRWLTLQRWRWWP